MCESPVLVDFRKLTDGPEYPLHRVYMYPASFTQYAVRYVIQFHGIGSQIVLDPFAGSGTVCVEAWLRGLRSACMDLNPLLDIFVRAKIYKGNFNDIVETARLVTADDPGCRDCPRWSRIGNWYHPRILEELCRLKCSLLSIIDRKEDDKLGAILLLAFLKTARHLSYTDPVIPKLYRPKKRPWRKEELIQSILSSNSIRKSVNDFFMKNIDSIAKLVAKSQRVLSYITTGSDPLLFSRVDVINDANKLVKYQITRYDLVITSPPYISAHEYIRSFKLELAWLNYTDDDLRSLAKMEIPYRRVPRCNIDSNTYHLIRSNLNEKKRILYDSYFHAIVRFFDKIVEGLSNRGVISIMVGRPRLDGLIIPIDKVLLEHFGNKGLECLEWVKDRIKRRRLPQGRNNSNPSGMEYEYMIILRKH